MLEASLLGRLEMGATPYVPRIESAAWIINFERSSDMGVLATDDERAKKDLSGILPPNDVSCNSNGGPNRKSHLLVGVGAAV